MESNLSCSSFSKFDDFPKTAKAYIVYRRERANLRETRREIPEHVRTLAEQSKEYFKNELAEFIYYRTYSRWIDGEGRRETWIETVDRYMDFMRENIGNKLIESEYKEWQRCLTVFTDDPYHVAIVREHLKKAKEKLIAAGQLSE